MDIFMVPKDCDTLVPVNLPDPKDGSLRSYFKDECQLRLYEAIKYHDEHRSWFLDNTFCKEAHMLQMTRVNPIFILLPHLITYASDKFRSLHDICSTQASSPNRDKRQSNLECALEPDIRWANVCDIQTVDDETYLKFSESKTLEWLSKVHAGTLATLKDSVCDSMETSTASSYACDLICVYLPEQIAVKFKTSTRSRGAMCQHSAGDTKRPAQVRKKNAMPAPNFHLVPYNNNNNTKKAKTEQPNASAVKPDEVGIKRFFKPKQ